MRSVYGSLARPTHLRPTSSHTIAFCLCGQYASCCASTETLTNMAGPSALRELHTRTVFLAARAIRLNPSNFLPVDLLLRYLLRSIGCQKLQFPICFVHEFADLFSLCFLANFCSLFSLLFICSISQSINSMNNL